MMPIVLRDSDDPESLFLQAEEYEERGDFESAYSCLLRCARLRDARCQNNLGNFYSNGTGVQKSVKNAEYWYKRAYNSGNVSGAFNMALEKRKAGNIRGAIYWFRKAIAMNDGDAYVELAKIYATRRGGKQLASELLTKAQSLSCSNITDSSNEEADFLLSKLRREETGLRLVRPTGSIPDRRNP